MSRPRAARIAAACLVLAATPLAALAAPPEPPAVPCLTGTTELLAGSQAGPGTRFAIAIGLTVATPSKPANGWMVGRCNSEQVFFTRSDTAGKDFMTALASHVGLAPWTDEAAFEGLVKSMLAASQPPGQHLRTVQFEASAVDGRPCVDVLRVGTVDAMPAPQGGVTPAMFTRERLRACHLRDARGPEAAVMLMFKEIAPHDPLRFDDGAQAFLAGAVLPAWQQ